MFQTQKQKAKDLYKKVKKDIFYWLIIINIIIWAVSFYNVRNFYNDYVNLVIKNAEAKTNPIVTEELPMRDWVLNEWEKVGQRDNANTIITCESRWNNNAYNINNNKTVDLGLYQFNTIHLDGFITIECAGDYRCSTKKAIELWQKKGNFCSWQCAKILGICN